ncbi:DNA-binding transcriptional regulator DsdC [Entomomonas sp. E2T0]|uniref:DNA-binding transcriptional regulator DsdC n=1 Tax=Entomomonas sp. E2T0 TaxID=2930213 RepID=UPI0022281A4F|nr:DNA-binding transcriptional regulator DsdC [Entomomonas sp. E2T0]UYZ83980.1 DNA-binding transcriptional regulator DsdC [Entomomonas sp. E2T0]
MKEPFAVDKTKVGALDQSLLNQKTILNDQYLINLQTFIYAARSLSFQAAAENLYLSPSAVSHRIGKLEKQLGFLLFHRFARKIKLTNEGERLYGVLKDSFAKINLEIQDIRSNELSGSLNIFSHPSVAEDWLIPRLVDFTQRYPAIQLNIRTGNEQANFQSQAIDVALYYSNGHFPGFNSECFMEEEIFPVCSQTYAAQYNLINQPENLAKCTLLHDAKAWHFAALDAEWHIWCKQMHIELPNSRSVITFDSSRSAAYAAIYHTGVAMGRLHLVHNWLATGRLITPFAIPALKTHFHYYLVWPRLQHIPPKLSVFLDWIKQQGAQSDKEHVGSF